MYTNKVEQLVKSIEQELCAGKNLDRAADDWDELVRLANLGAVLEALPNGGYLEHYKDEDGDWNARLEIYQTWRAPFLRESPAHAQGKTPLEALTKLYADDHYHWLLKDEAEHKKDK